MTHDEMIAVIAAHRDGKQIQYWSTVISNAPTWRDVADNKPSWDFHESCYRVKPKKVKRLIRVDELPMPCFVRKENGSSTYAYSLAQAMHSDMGIFAVNNFGASWMSIQHLHEDNCRYSADGKTWKSFEVES